MTGTFPTAQLMTIKPEIEDNQGWWEKQSHNKKLQQRFNDSARDLAVLKEGQPVLVQDWSQHRRKWQEAQISKQLTSRAYAVQLNNNLFRRNRRDIGPLRLSRSHRVLRHQRILNKMLVAPKVKPPRAPIIATTYGVQPENRSPLVGWQTMCPLKTFVPN
ncbi:hypothetical protein EB796_004053 [Bugula neritina]|uniref:Uncharacterized protein n=1 Tax=Bugula neritina TaxID=10212 RepID=A0A7J7KG46_BUGNE|nr:hypothetical protein EB796_004053 [Bugula neritina]